MISYKGAVASSPSRNKKFNEDNFFFNSKIITDELSSSQILLSHKKEQRGLQIYAVMDGAGSETYEDSASLVAAEKLKEYYTAIAGSREEKMLSNNDIKRYLDSYVNSTDKAVKEKVRELLGQKVFTTIGLICINGTNIMAINVGDTKILRLKDGKIEQISIDDTQAQRMIDKGVATPERVKSSLKKNKLTQYLGVLPEGEVLSPHYISLEATHGDMFIICSGSICNSIPEERMADVIAGKKTPAEVVDTIMSEAIDCNIREDATIMAIQAMDSEVAGADAAAIPGVASGIKKSGAKKDKLYEGKDKEDANGDKKDEGSQTNKKGESSDTGDNKFLIPIVVIGVVIIMILLLVFGIKTYKNSTQEPTASPTAEIEEETAEPSEEPTAEPTRIPTATPTPEDGTPTPTSEPTPTPTIEVTSEPTATPTPTATIAPGETSIPVEYIIVNKTNEELDINETLQINVTFYPENATDKMVKWKSSNTNVATVDENGLITAVKEGTANITVTPNDAGSKTIVITVVATRADSVALDLTEKAVMAGEEFDLAFTVTPEKAYYEQVAWSSSDENVATVDENGHVTAIGGGTATITLTLEDGSESSKSATCTVNVSAIIPVESISLDVNELTLKIDETYTLIADLLPIDATNKNITWSSDGEDFVTVDENGTVTAITPGNAVVTVTTEDGNYTATCEVIVLEPVKPASIELDKTEVTIIAGFEETITATVLPEDAVNKNLIWSSDNEEIATVDQTGKITAVATGNTVITVTAEDGGCMATCNVTVPEPVKPSSIELDKTEVTLVAGFEETITATVLPEDAVNKNIIWSSENEEIATVDEAGKITAVAEGETTITVKAEEDETVIATVTVTVTPVINVETITLGKTEITMEVGERSKKPSAEITPEDATYKDLVWTVDPESENPEAIAFDGNFIEAVSAGTATIIVSDVTGTITATISVTVTE